MHSIVWRLSLPTGCVLTASLSGSSETRARMEDARTPLGDEARHAYAEMIGADGARLLNAIYEAPSSSFLREMPSVEILRQVWVQNYLWSEGTIRWRFSEDISPAAKYIGSPYDTEAHYSKKRSTTWVGYVRRVGADEIPA